MPECYRAGHAGAHLYPPARPLSGLARRQPALSPMNQPALSPMNQPALSPMNQPALSPDRRRLAVW